MTMRDHLLPAEAARPDASPLKLSDLSASLRARLTDWIATAADYYTAEAVYEQLSRLSDVELQRRGHPRATLAWDIAQARDRANV